MLQAGARHLVADVQDEVVGPFRHPCEGDPDLADDAAIPVHRHRRRVHLADEPVTGPELETRADSRRLLAGIAGGPEDLELDVEAAAGGEHAVDRQRGPWRCPPLWRRRDAGGGGRPRGAAPLFCPGAGLPPPPGGYSRGGGAGGGGASPRRRGAAPTPARTPPRAGRSRGGSTRGPPWRSAPCPPRCRCCAPR